MTPRGAVIFDFDGVLADTEAIHLAAFQEVFGARGWPLDEAEYFDRYLGYDDRGLIRQYARLHGHTVQPAEIEAIVVRKADAYLSRLSAGDVLYPAARETVARLGNSFPLAVATGSLGVEVRTILAATNLLGAFRGVIAADDVVHAKPAPDTYLAAAAAVGLEPASCVAIEDSAGGLASARAAGLRTVGITTTSPADRLAHADCIVQSLAEISVETVVTVLHRWGEARRS